MVAVDDEPGGSFSYQFGVQGRENEKKHNRKQNVSVSPAGITCLTSIHNVFVSLTMYDSRADGSSNPPGP